MLTNVLESLLASGAQPNFAHYLVQRAFGVIVGMTDAFCRERLSKEYAVLCRNLAEKLARKRPSPLTSGTPSVWAAGIVRTIGLVNFLQDPSQNPHMKLAEVDSAFGVSNSASQAKSMTIRRMFRVHEFDPQWTLPSRMDGNPFTWMVKVNGLVIDVRHAPRSVQEIAHQRGLIPHIPGIQE